MDRGTSASDAFARLRSAGEDPLGYLASRPAGGPPAIGYVCSYVPEEILLAAGLHPVRLGAQPGPTGPANGCLQSFACSFARGLLDGLLVGRWSGLVGVVFVHTCDSLRAAYESWKVHAPAGSFVHFLNLPARVEGPGVEAYAASEMARLAKAVGGIPGGRPVTAENLAAACELVATVRAGLSRLSALRSARPDLLPGSDFIALARGATVIDRTEAARLLAAVADDLEAKQGGSRPRAGDRPRVAVSGGFLETEGPLRLVESSGGDIVWDDLCLGGRRLGFPDAVASKGPAASGSDSLSGAIARLAALYLGRIPCPAKHPPARRFDWVLGGAAENRVDGFVFLLQKFCDPHAFDYPALRGSLEIKGYPCLLIEVEQGAAAAGQASTRLEALMERLASREKTMGGASR